MGDGLLGKCKECTKKDAGAQYRERLEHNQERKRDYYRSGRGKEKLADATKRYRARNPEKYKAHTAVSNAIRGGRLTKKPCEKCGNMKSEGHHEDYSRPLDVRWLCQRCHRVEHGALIAF